ncbi:MAG: hypothetical protein JWM62_225 [Frankiales bacterium]|nr:hypothetical protein [Frankiales bacterium]
MEERQRPSKISDEALLAAVPAAANIRQLLQALGVAAYGGNYEVIRERLRLLGVDEARFGPRPRPVAIAASRLVEAVARSDSWAKAARRLGVPGNAGERRIKGLALEAGLDTAHFLGQGWNRGVRLGGREAEPLRTLLVRGRYVGTSRLRHRLLREQVLEACCAACGRDTWEGAPIPLELDHLNGDRTDNRLENLRLLCPNCHARTDTYRGRNIGASGARETVPIETTPAIPDAVRAQRRLLALLGGSA